MSYHIVLYNLVLAISLIGLAPVWLVWLACTPKIRLGFWQKLGFYPLELLDAFKQVNRSQPVVWLHTVSVGEFNAVRPLIKALQAENIQLVISTTTGTGQELAQTVLKKQSIPVFYFPFDLGHVLNGVLDTLRPDLVLLTETELWPNFIHWVTQRRKKPLFLINGRISPHSHRGYRYLRQVLTRPMLKELKHCFMQSKADAERLMDLGASNEQISVIGNIKFDLDCSRDEAKIESFREMFGFEKSDIVLTCASTHAGEEEIMTEVFIRLRKDFPELKLVLAPRHPERTSSIRSLLNNRALRYSLRSQLDESTQNLQPIVLLDTIGELKTVYGLSTLAVMGGSFIPHGGQNPLEPLSMKVPVLFGPNMFNFPEISRLIIQSKAGIQVANAEQLIDQLTALLTQPEKYSFFVENGQHILEENRGVKDHLVREILKTLGKNPKSETNSDKADTLPLSS